MSEAKSCLYWAAFDILDATRQHDEGNIEAARDNVTRTKRLCDDYLKMTDQPKRTVSHYTSPKGNRPEGWFTVMEYIAAHRPDLLDMWDDVAVESSHYGIKASRLMRERGEKPVHVDAPECFSEEHRDHFQYVYTYPLAVLKRVVG